MKKLGFIAAFLLLSSIHALACTTAVISAEASSTGRPMLWKQRDAPDEFNVLVHLRGEKYAFTALFGSGDHARKNAYCGANDHGFAVMNNLSYNLRPDSLGTATNAGRLMKEALGTCLTVGDFEKLLEEKGREYGLSTNFGVIDAFGGAAYFEVWEYGCVRYDASAAPGGYLFRTNYSLSGREDKGKGYVRYQTAGYLMGRQASRKFSPEWLIDGLGGSFYNAQTREDLLKSGIRKGRMAQDVDYIPRMTTTASIVIEGVSSAQDPEGPVLWTAIGYTPCCYAVPVWVAAGDNIPVTVFSSADGKAPANIFANELKHRLHPLTFEGGEAYIDIFTFRKEILPKVRKAEKAEFKAAEALEKKFRTGGFDVNMVKDFNAESQKRFQEFHDNIHI